MSRDMEGNVKWKSGGIEGAGNPAPAPVEDMGVDHGGSDIGVSEQLLDGSDVVAVFDEMGGEGMAEGVAGAVFGDAGAFRAALTALCRVSSPAW